MTGLFEGPVWVFVQPEADKTLLPVAIPTTTGESRLKIVLRRPGEPTPTTPKEPKVPPETQRETLAKTLIAKALREAGDKPLPRRLHAAWARLDPEAALARLGPAKGAAADLVRIAIVEQLLPKDFDEALALANQCEPANCFYALRRVAEKLARTDPAKARRLAEELLAWARRLNMPERAWALAQVATLVGRLGQDDAHRKLLQEAADLVETIGGEQRQGYARGLVATELVTIDLERAMQLVAKITAPHEQARHRIDIAIALAAKDATKALALYESVTKQNPRSN